MARIKISVPDKTFFSTDIPVRITDLNYGNHVGNDTILSMLHEARVQFLASLGYSELDLGGTSLIMGDVAIEFKSELFYGDTVKASVCADEFSRVGFDLYYKLEKDFDSKTILVAVAKTGMVCFNYTIRKVTAVPDEVIKKLKS
ncbi:MAG: acyl-CoA thioesterase [Flavitalea sp.]